MSMKVRAYLRPWLPQPAIGAATAALALLVLAASWLGIPAGLAGAKNVPVILVSLCLVGAAAAAYQFPLQVRPHTKVHVSSIAYYLMAVLLPSPLAATAAGLSALVGELSVRGRRGTYAGDIAAQVGRRTVVVALGAQVAHLAGPAHTVPALVGAALVLLVGDIITCPLVLAPMTGEPPLRLIVAVAQDAGLVEGAQYLIGLLGALAVRQDYWALALLTLPAALVYLAFRAAGQAEEAQQAAEQARRAAQEAQQRAEEAVHVRDDFLTVASHDLRTPLTVIMGQLDLMRLQVESGQAVTASWLRSHLHPLVSAGARMNATVEEMTDVAQLQLGQPLSLHVSALDVGEMVRAAVSLIAAGLGHRPLSVEIEAPDGVVVLGDRLRLERVVQNVVGNAVKYSAHGTPVHVSVVQGEQWATITVRDRGVGIPADEIPRIFTRFYRASTAMGVAGTGIGLAGARAILEQHGGHIAVQSAVGQGTMVTIHLPLAPWSIAATQPELQRHLTDSTTPDSGLRDRKQAS